MPTEYIHTCKCCGKQWNVKKVKLTARDKDSERCTCGEEIINWNGSTIYYVTPIDSLTGKAALR